MHFLRFLALAALSITSVTAKKASTKFDTYFAKQASSAPFEIDEKGYNELTTAPRDYSLAVLLTARDARYACGLCKEFDPEWTILGRSWQKGDKNGAHRLLLSTVDFDNGRNVFMRVSKRYIGRALPGANSNHSFNSKRPLSSCSSLLLSASMPNLMLSPHDSTSLDLKPRKASTAGWCGIFLLVEATLQ